MSENLRNFTKALYGFDHVARSVKPNAWGRKSPCEGWTARDVAGHIVSIMKMTDAYARAKEPNMKALFDFHKVATDDPAAAGAKARDSVLEALDQPGVLHRSVTTMFGEGTIDGFLRFMTADACVHTWDLARATKTDERLDSGLCKYSLAVYKTFPSTMLRQSGVFGPEIKPAAGADPQAKLLGFAGRTL